MQHPIRPVSGVSQSQHFAARDAVWIIDSKTVASWRNTLFTYSSAVRIFKKPPNNTVIMYHRMHGSRTSTPRLWTMTIPTTPSRQRQTLNVLQSLQCTVVQLLAVFSPPQCQTSLCLCLCLCLCSVPVLVLMLVPVPAAAGTTFIQNFAFPMLPHNCIVYILAL